MDLLDNEEDIIDVKQRLDNFINSEKPLVKGENRSHYISAKAALQSILNGTNNEYLQAFQDFVNYLEQFLIFERGKLKINQAIIKIDKLLNLSFQELEKSIKRCETERQEIIEKIGEASGRDVKIRILGKQAIEQAIQEAEESWNKWEAGLTNRLILKSHNWTSQHNPVLSQKDLIKDYSTFFNSNLVYEIDDWGNKELGKSILTRNIKLLDAKIELEIEAVEAYFHDTKQQVKTNLQERVKFSINGLNDDFAGVGGFLGGLGIGGALAAGLLFLTPLGLVAIVAASITAAVGSSFGLGMLDLDGLREQIKIKVVESGFQNFEASKDKIFDKLYEIVELAINNKVQASSHELEKAILRHENSLEQKDKAYQKMLEQCKAKKVEIAQKCQELKQLQIKIDKEYS
jgi:hypothetical protein